MADRFSPKPFHPVWWLRNRHIQTLYPALLGPRPNVAYRRERWETPDGDFIDLDWIDGAAENPVVLACHGLEGCSRAPYMLRLMAAVQQIGWTGIAFNFRGCSGEPNRLLRMYHSGETGDLHWIVERLRERHAGRPLFVTGYSLGGNVTAKWLGEKQGSIPTYVRGAAVCCAPYDLAASQCYIDCGPRWFYTLRFIRLLRRKVRWKLQDFPNTFDARRTLRAFTFKAFDDAFTAPIHGFADYEDYYRRSSSKPYLKFIQVPTLLVHALDDPFIPASSLPTSEDINPQKVTLCYTQHGGHTGYVTHLHDVSWMESTILDWFRHLYVNS